VVERLFFYIKHRIKRFYNVPWKISKVLWEFVLTAVKHEFITTSYASWVI